MPAPYNPTGTALTRWMGRLSAAGAVTALAAPLVVFLDPSGSFGQASRVDQISAAQIAAAPLAARLIGLALDAVPDGLMAWALYCLALLFFSYARSAVFSAASLTLLKRVAYGLFASTLAGLLVQPLLSLAISWHLGPGRRAISFGLGNDQIFILFLAGAVLVVARAMTEAVRLADENASFV